eukprot:1161275-Pelagomonas_calceolata.AAC.12
MRVSSMTCEKSAWAAFSSLVMFVRLSALTTHAWMCAQWVAYPTQLEKVEETGKGVACVLGCRGAVTQCAHCRAHSLGGQAERDGAEELTGACTHSGVGSLRQVGSLQGMALLNSQMGHLPSASAWCAAGNDHKSSHHVFYWG